MRQRKWDSYRSGEELFGLPVTQYPELERTQEEINMLDKLYRCGVVLLWYCFSTCSPRDGGRGRGGGGGGGGYGLGLVGALQESSPTHPCARLAYPLTLSACLFL